MCKLQSIKLSGRHSNGLNLNHRLFRIWQYLCICQFAERIYWKIIRETIGSKLQENFVKNLVAEKDQQCASLLFILFGAHKTWSCKSQCTH